MGLHQKNYLDMYKGIQSEIISTTRFDENSYLSTTYLGRTDLARDSKIKAEERYPISEQGYMIRKFIGWYRMSDTIGYRSQQISSVLVTLPTV